VSGHPGERLSAYLDGELSADDRAEVQVHLRECADCAHALEELAAVDAFARELPVEAPAGYFEELPGRVRARVRRPVRAPRLAVWAAVAAAAVMAVVVTPVMLQRESSVVAPAAQAVPEAPAPATLAASITPPPVAGFADSGAAASAGARPLRAARNEARGRLLEREKADHAAEEKMLSQAQAQGADQVRRRDEPAALPPGPPAVTAAPPAPKATMAESVEVQGATAPEGTPAEPEADADAKKERARPASRQAVAGAGAFAHPNDRALMTDKRYQALLARQATSAPEARAARDAWELFARDVPADARADEARVRAIEAGVLAWKLGRDPADLATARERGRAYLESANAPQAARVRAALEGLP
jgi:hypothetical protein